MAVEIAIAKPEEMDGVRRLFREYRASVDAEICFTTFETEVAELPGAYQSILVARDGNLAGCVALRHRAEGACEMKRLFVRPAHQGAGLGRALIEAAIAEAKRLGYRRMLLDTLPWMNRAIAVYGAMGFTQTGRYNDNPHPGTLFFERQLS